MNKSLLFAALMLLAANTLTAQDSAAFKAQQTAKGFQRQGDFTNAILVLNRALQADNENLELQKDLAFNYYLNKNFVKALEVSKPFAERKDADVQSFQILGMVYKALEERKECEKMYKAALKKYPNSGVLYNEYGEMMWSKDNFSESLKLWEKGIEVDANYSSNYYNAAKYYFFTQDKVWSLIYGEIFVNLESYSKRTPEIKKIILEGYKKLFTDGNMTKGQDNKSEFVKAYLDLMKTQSPFIADNGVTAESLSAVRTKFIIDWMEKYSAKFPFRLYDHHQQLLKEGMFDAYNQWLFGSTANLTVYETWTKAHPEEFKKFDYFQHNRVFKIPAGQYYNAGK